MTAADRLPPSLGPIQIGNELSLAQFQTERALKAGLIPAPEADGRWPRTVIDGLRDRAQDIAAAAGSIPDLGAVRAAWTLGGRLGVEVHPDTIVELAARGMIPEAGEYKGWPVYCGRAIEAFSDPDALADAAEKGALLTADKATERLVIRRSDFDHLVRAGLVSAASWSLGPFQSRRERPTVPLYRAGDLDDLTRREDLDWEAVRSVPKGGRSALAALPDSRGAR